MMRREEPKSRNAITYYIIMQNTDDECEATLYVHNYALLRTLLVKTTERANRVSVENKGDTHYLYCRSQCVE